MEAILRSGQKINGKVADLFVKIGIAKPEGETWPVAKKKVVKKAARKPAAKKATQVKQVQKPVTKAVAKVKPVVEKQPVVLLTEVKTDFVKPGEQHVFKLKAKK